MAKHKHNSAHSQKSKKKKGIHPNNGCFGRSMSTRTVRAVNTFMPFLGSTYDGDWKDGLPYPMHLNYITIDGEVESTTVTCDKELSEFMLTEVGENGARVIGQDGQLWGVREIDAWARQRGI